MNAHWGVPGQMGRHEGLISPTRRRQTRPFDCKELLADDKFHAVIAECKRMGLFSDAPEDTSEYNRRVERMALSYSRVENEKRASLFRRQGISNAKIGAYREAISCYDRAVEISFAVPSKHITLANRSAALVKVNLVAEALRDAEKAASAKPDFSTAHAMVGYCHSLMERYEEAISAYERALELSPAEENTRRLLQVAQKNLARISEGAAPDADKKPQGRMHAASGQALASLVKLPNRIKSVITGKGRDPASNSKSTVARDASSVSRIPDVPAECAYDWRMDPMAHLLSDRFDDITVALEPMAADLNQPLLSNPPPVSQRLRGSSSRARGSDGFERRFPTGGADLPSGNMGHASGGGGHSTHPVPADRALVKASRDQGPREPFPICRNEKYWSLADSPTPASGRGRETRGSTGTQELAVRGPAASERVTLGRGRDLSCLTTESHSDGLGRDGSLVPGVVPAHAPPSGVREREVRKGPSLSQECFAEAVLTGDALRELTPGSSHTVRYNDEKLPPPPSPRTPPCMPRPMDCAPHGSVTRKWHKLVEERQDKSRSRNLDETPERAPYLDPETSDLKPRYLPSSRFDLQAGRGEPLGRIRRSASDKSGMMRAIMCEVGCVGPFTPGTYPRVPGAQMNLRHTIAGRADPRLPVAFAGLWSAGAEEWAKLSPRYELDYWVHWPNVMKSGSTDALRDGGQVSRRSLRPSSVSIPDSAAAEADETESLERANAESELVVEESPTADAAETGVDMSCALGPEPQGFAVAGKAGAAGSSRNTTPFTISSSFWSWGSTSQGEVRKQQPDGLPVSTPRAPCVRDGPACEVDGSKDAEAARDHEEQVAHLKAWMQAVTALECGSSTSLQGWLRDGTVLASLAKALKRDVVQEQGVVGCGAAQGRDREPDGPSPEENLKTFFGACEALGVPKEHHFDPADLSHNAGLEHVVRCLEKLRFATRGTIIWHQGSSFRPPPSSE